MENRRSKSKKSENIKRKDRTNWVNVIGNGANTSRGKIYRTMDIDVETKKNVIVFQDRDTRFSINRLRFQIK